MNVKGFKISFRILFKYRLYTGISLFGLGIAIASFWFIANYVKDSHQYDAFHEKSDRIYRLSMEVSAGGSTDHYATTGKPPGYILSNNYSGVTAYAKMTFNGNSVVKIQNEVFSEEGFFNVMQKECLRQTGFHR
jgi:putative ABC transport system permease protein